QGLDLLVASLQRLDHVHVAEDADGDDGAEDQQATLAALKGGHGQRPFGGRGAAPPAAAGGAGGGGAPAGRAPSSGPPGRSPPALRRNCSRSRPFVTGEVNSTRSKVGEPSRSGMSWAAALANPASSSPFRSTDTFVSQTSCGSRSVSSRSRGRTRTCCASKLRNVST